jgi:hypothetical protein
MPRSYLPTLLALKLPLLTLVLGILGTLGAACLALRSAIDPRRRATLLMLALAVLVPIAITVAMRPAMYNGIRHFLFVLPPLAVLGGLAAARMLSSLRRLGRLAVGAAGVAMLACLAVPVAGMATLHPYEYTYFNIAAGGVRGASDRFMLDYWGLSFRQAALALRAELAKRGEQPPPGGWTTAVCGPHPPAHVALGPDFNLTWNPNGADFAMMLGVFYCVKLDAPLLAEIQRNGVTYARVYDIRGRTVTSILTRPPP